MMRLLAKRMIVCLLGLSLVGVGLPPAGHAAMIGTQTLVEAEQADAGLARIDAFVAQERVRTQMLALGADPEQVRDRLSALTEEEIRLLDEQIESLPAGGILAVIGVVFVVLLVLEIVGVIDIFKKV